MMNHTKAPWTVNGPYLDDPHVITIRGGNGFVGEVYSAISRPEEAAANAQLIAAAPELLEALEGMLEWARRVTQPNAGPEVVNAHNAIAKARGQRDECSHGVRRDLCPDCSPDNADYMVLPSGAIAGNAPAGAYRPTDEELDAQYAPRNHSHNASCYMLGQRQVSYRTCGKLEGESQ